MNIFLSFFFIVFSTLFKTPTDHHAASIAGEAVETNMKTACKRPNVLFIAIDDLRPELGCYGASHIISPNIDKLAAQGVLFGNAFCQAPRCDPSRSSLLTGVGVMNFKGDPRSPEELAPGIKTLPATFRQAGYYTISNGKIYHLVEHDAEQSWSEPPFSLVTGPKGSKLVATLGGNNFLAYMDKESAKFINQKNQRGPFFEAPDVPDSAYIDGKICDKTIKDLRNLAKMDKPFFLACGFVRPHLPFYAPKKYWDLYNEQEIKLANNRYKPINSPEALHGSGEIKGYHDRNIEYNSDKFHNVARHGYYACVSYADALVGKLLAELDKLGLRENTIIVLWGDHGWNLGEHNYWSKHNLLYNSKHAPLIISAPGFKKNIKTNGIVELIDIYPTLCELAGIPKPKHLEGKSVVPLLRNPHKKGKKAAYTKYGNGISVVTANFSYSEWGNGQRMLFDLKTDPDENINVAEQMRYKKTVKRMKQLLNDKIKNP